MTPIDQAAGSSHRGAGFVALPNRAVVTIKAGGADLEK
jgi:hypothetical protein